MINGECRIGDRTFIGSGVVISNDISVASDCIVAGASFVRKSINQSGIYAGNPAIKYK